MLGSLIKNVFFSFSQVVHISFPESFILRWKTMMKEAVAGTTLSKARHWSTRSTCWVSPFPAEKGVTHSLIPFTFVPRALWLPFDMLKVLPWRGAHIDQ